MYLPRLRDLREDHDLKQEEVANLLGIQQTEYSGYERGARTIPLEHLVKLAEVYQASVDALLEHWKP